MTALRPATFGARPLDDTDLPALRHLVGLDPIVNAVFDARLSAAATLRPEQLGGELLGIGGGSEALRAACFLGGNVLPVGGQPDEWRVLAAQLAVRPRNCSSIVGTAAAMDVVWPVLRASWGPARLLRPRQPLLVTAAPAPVVADERVRPARMNELERYLPAAAAMFAEELGLAPFRGATRPTYRMRLAELIGGGRAFVRLDPRGEVIFKAEIGAVSAATCQVQGVWVRPDLRGRGIATAAMAAVIVHALRLAPTVSLYVNDFNLPGRRLYDRLGMRQIATLATVLF